MRCRADARRRAPRGAEIISARSQNAAPTEIAATFYTVLETSKLEGVDTATYLREAALANARGEVLPADLKR